MTRTYTGTLRKEHTGTRVVLDGWIQKRRDFGELIFLDVRDRSGIVQVVVDRERGASAELVATAFSFSWDPVLSLAADATGRIEGAIDIPGFAFDADVDILAQGETLQVHVAVLDQTVEDALLDINDFQATGA